MSEVQTEVTTDDIELRIEDARAAVKEADALARLLKNPDWKLVISDSYFRDHAVRLVEYKASPAAQSEETQASILAKIDAIGGLQQHLRAVEAFGEGARQAIIDGQEMIDEMLAEGAA